MKSGQPISLTLMNINALAGFTEETLSQVIQFPSCKPAQFLLSGVEM